MQFSNCFHQFDIFESDAETNSSYWTNISALDVHKTVYFSRIDIERKSCPDVKVGVSWRDSVNEIHAKTKSIWKWCVFIILQLIIRSQRKRAKKWNWFCRQYVSSTHGCLSHIRVFDVVVMCKNKNATSPDSHCCCVEAAAPTSDCAASSFSH